MIRLIWIRHGETEENRARRYLGHYDAPLTAFGREQAASAALLLQHETIHSIYTSDLIRCRETAAIVARPHDVEPRVVPELRELDFGAWDRKTYEEIMLTHKTLAERWYNNPHDVAPPNGESLRDLRNRLGVWLDALVGRMKPGETAVLVTHGGPIRWFLATYVAEDPQAFWSVTGPGTGSVIVTNKGRQKWMASSL
ncbi:histidine phosphatase family protein [Aneurinibacillus sp. REN35]|uniref:histidine phosphatase family protein n=1 Tax=Aneurinibacillus sp. REN35 TaxID=3237286 RepID=UPI0035298F1D